MHEAEQCYNHMNYHMLVAQVPKKRGGGECFSSTASPFPYKTAAEKDVFYLRMQMTKLRLREVKRSQVIQSVMGTWLL